MPYRRVECRVFNFSFGSLRAGAFSRRKANHVLRHSVDAAMLEISKEAAEGEVIAR
jgi:hypothetical protein